MKKFITVLTAGLIGAFCLMGCGTDNRQAAKTDADVNTEIAAETETESETATEEAAVPAEDGKTAILVVSFGTSYNESRDLTIGAIETAIADAFPEYEVRRAFTSQIIIDILAEREGLEIDNVEEALDRAVADGITKLVVQPTHLMSGYEYTDLADALDAYADKFDAIALGAPLLTSDADYDSVIKAITAVTADYDDGETAICFMGHGTEADSNGVYAALQEKLTAAGYENYYIGTVEATPGLEDVIAALGENGTYKKVVLRPLMVVAGDHANNDMAGDEEDSWKVVLTQEGYEVEPVLEGLGQIPEIQKLYVEHTQDAIDSMENEEVTPVTGEALADGTYQIEAESSSSMFRIVNAVLHVEGGEMSADITLSGQGYSMLYMGTGEEALLAEEDAYIPYVEDAEGAYTYTVPVEALNTEIDCAAYSKRKERWYDRTLVFSSALLPEEVYVGAAKPADSNVTPAHFDVEDGVYTMEVTLAGGSGKASVESPAQITVRENAAVATIVWSSANYDYMIVNGEKYLPVSVEEHSVFEIPVYKLDEELEIIADTTAMSKLHEVAYTLYFDSATLQREETALCGL